MKKFHFRLQKLLDLRAFREKEAETALSKAIAVRDGIVLRLKEIAQQELNTRTGCMPHCKTAADFTVLEYYLEHLYTEREYQLNALTEAELLIQQKQEIYVNAHRERLIITKLREKKEYFWKAAYAKEQDNTVDDIVNNAQYRKCALED